MARTVKAGQLEWQLTGKDKSFGQALQGAEGKAKKFGGFMNKWALGVAGAIAGAFAIKEITGFAVSLGKQAVALEASRAKAETVFGDWIIDVEQWADANAAAMGLTDEQLVGLAANMGDLLKPMGFTSAEAHDMSTEMLDLAGALAAYNTDIDSAEQASQILTRALLGERDALVSLGIKIDEEMVKARLAAKGQEDLEGQALRAAKAIATQELIYEQTTDAQKAWADGSLDNVKAMNQLSAAWAEGKEELANKFLPVVTAFVGFMSEHVIPFVERVRFVFGRDGLAGVWAFVSTQWKRHWPEIEAFIGNALSTLFDLWKEWAPKILEFLVGLSADLWAWVIDSIPGWLDALGKFIDSGVRWLSEEGWPRFTTWLRDEGIPQFIAWVEEVTPPTLKALGEFLWDVGRWLVTTGVPALFKAANQLWGAILGAFKEKVDELQSDGRQWLRDAAADMFRSMYESAIGWIDTLLENVRNAIDGIVQWFKDIPSRVGGPVGDFAKGLFGAANGVTNWQGGPLIVGERGPEVVTLPRGSNVIPNHRLSGGGAMTGGTTINVTVQGSVLSERDLAAAITDTLRHGHRIGVG